jgi:hypothetical protein
MYTLWFKLRLGDYEFRIDCQTIEQAREVYDAGVAAGWYAMQVRP